MYKWMAMYDRSKYLVVEAINHDTLRIVNTSHWYEVIDPMEGYRVGQEHKVFDSLLREMRLGTLELLIDQILKEML